MPLRKDIWRPAIVEAPAAQIVHQGGFGGAAVHWLPEMPAYCFLADPFGLWRDGLLFVFVERFDYRTRRGEIDVLIYDSRYRLLDRRLALAAPWHLSYPFVFQAEGATWMLPEAHRSGRLTLYRARTFPWDWEAAHEIDLGGDIAIDATPAWHDGRWWLFYSVAGDANAKMGELHVAHAERLSGPWTRHPDNPIRTRIDSARPGGTPIVADGMLLLPVQDCSRTYGGAIGFLQIDPHADGRVRTQLESRIEAPAAFFPFTEGLHSFSSVGPVTLIDVKRTVLRPRGLAIEARREIGRMRRRWAGSNVPA